MKTIKLDDIALPGNHISEACRNAVATAKRERCKIQFDFNEIELTATPTTDPDQLANAFMAESERRHAAYIASPKYKRFVAEQERKERERETKLRVLLANMPAHMTLRDAEVWKKSCEVNSDGYGGAVMKYAERWARVMEARMAKGEELADIAEESSDLANEEGITGFMYGCAVGILSQVWKHGEELRRWHNLKTQIRDEGEKANESGGVLNPAVLNLGNT